MKLEEAISKRIVEIEKRHHKTVEEINAKKCQLVAAMRERLCLQYDVEFSDEEVAGWDVGAVSDGKITWRMYFNNRHGYVCSAHPIDLIDVEPPGTDFKWAAYNWSSKTEITTEDFISATVFALHGKK